AFLGFGTAPNPWFFDGSNNTARCNTAFGTGYIPLTLPDGATLVSVRIQGNSGEAYFGLFRHQTPTSSVADVIVQPSFVVPGGNPIDFDNVYAVPNTYRYNIVDNVRYNYFFWGQTGQRSTMVNRININYQY